MGAAPHLLSHSRRQLLLNGAIASLARGLIPARRLRDGRMAMSTSRFLRARRYRLPRPILERAPIEVYRTVVLNQEKSQSV
jgi:hypothetical protein